jgi:hypothetical protein
MRTVIPGIGALAMLVGSLAGCGGGSSFSGPGWDGEGGEEGSDEILGSAGPPGDQGAGGRTPGETDEAGTIVPLDAGSLVLEAGSVGTGASGGDGGDGGAKGAKGSLGAGGTKGDGGIKPRKTCHTATGSGALEICAVIADDAPGFTCPAEYVSAGPCPSPMALVGCCVTTTHTGESVSEKGNCYYDATIAAVAKDACIGASAKWVPRSP